MQSSALVTGAAGFNCSHEKLTRVLGVEAKVDLPTGVERMVKWARRHGARQTKEFAAIEIKRNLPESWQPLVSSAHR
jgi:hypothetical protein